MSYVPTNRVLSDPGKNARLFHLIAPVVRAVGGEVKFSRPDLQKIHRLTLEYGKHNKVVSGLEQDVSYHKIAVRRVREREDLSSRRWVMIPFSSPDLTDTSGRYMPNKLGVDVFSERRRDSEDIWLTAMRVRNRYGWDNFKGWGFMRLSPRLELFELREEGVYDLLEDCVRDAYNIHNGWLGSTEKKPFQQDFSKGLAMFSECLIDSGHAFRVFGQELLRLIELYRVNPAQLTDEDFALLVRVIGDEKKILKTRQKDVKQYISRHTRYNQILLAEEYGYFLKDILGVNDIYVFALKTSPTMAVAKLMSERHGIRIDDIGGVLSKVRHGPDTCLGVCHPSALDKLAGRFYEEIEYPLDLKGSVPSLPKVDWRKEDLVKPENCPDLACYRCCNKGECDEHFLRTGTGHRGLSLDKCVAEWVRGNYEKKDLAELLPGIPERVDEVLQELEWLHKPIIVKGFSEPITPMQLLEEDAHKIGYSFLDIMGDLAILNGPNDEFIFKVAARGERLSRSWQRFRANLRLEPFVIPSQSLQDYQLRASGFYSKCHLSGLYGNVDTSKLPLPVIPNRFSVVGTARHTLALFRHPFAEVRVFARYPNVLREQGEVEEIVVSGHSDCVGISQLTDGEHAYAAVLDYKRAPKGADETPAYLLQLLHYWNGVQAAVGVRFEGALQILIKRFFGGRQGDYAYPEYSIHFADESSYGQFELDQVVTSRNKIKITCIQGVPEIVSHTYKMQKLLLEDKGFYVWYLGEMRQNDFCYDEKKHPDCRECFQKDICDIVEQEVRRGRSINDFLYDHVEF